MKEPKTAAHEPGSGSGLGGGDVEAALEGSAEMETSHPKP